MDFIKNGMKNLESIGFGSAVPGLRDSLKNIVSNVTSSDSDQKAKIQSVIDADRAAREEKPASNRSQGRMMQQAKTEDAGGYKGYKKGGKVSSASKRADGCCIRGKTKA